MSTPRVDNDLPVELTAPDISAYAAGNTGVPYAWRFAGASPGPSAMISAVIHGNEPCGAIALDWLLARDFRPARGSLTLVFANVDAYQAFDPKDPTTTRWVDEDMNRVWAPEVLEGDRDSVELRRARAMRPLLEGLDALLDIHSMQQPSPPLMMAGPLAKGARMAAALGAPERVVSDQGHAAGKRMRDYGAFGDPDATPAALLMECGQHWEAAAGPLAKETAARFLQHLGMDDGALMAALEAETGPRPAPATQRFFEVTDPITIESDAGFTFAKPFSGGEILAEAGTLIGHDGDRAVVTPYPDCMLVMPSKRLWRGMTAVRMAQERTAPT